MVGKRVVILDGSHSLFGAAVPDTDTEMKEKGSDGEENGAVGVLQAIPNFRKLIEDVVHDTSIDYWGAESNSVALIDVGLVCDASVAGKVGLAVFKRVIDRLNGQQVR